MKHTTEFAKAPTTTGPASICRLDAALTPLNKTPLNKTPLNKTPLNKTPLNKTPLNKTPLNKTALNTTALSVTVMSLIAWSLSAQSLVAQTVTGSKGDYKAPAEQKTQGSTAVPKSIYMTPKSDRLGQPADNGTVHTTDTKSDRQHVSPADEEPWVADPEEDIATTNPQDNKAGVPEITIPFDSKANKPAKATAPKRRKKRKRKAKAKRPIDVAYSNGRLKLNRFHTLKIDMLHHECRDFPNIFLADYKLPRKAIDILSDNMLIVQKRICADNGAVLITCYQNSATISMRRARPGDGCKRK